MKRLLVLLIVFTIIISFVVGCAPKQPEKPASSDRPIESTLDEDLPVLRTGSFPFRISFGLWYIMNNGLDVANGFRIETVEVTNGAAINEAFGAGLLDVAQIGTAAAVNSAAVYKCRILAEISEGSGALNLFARPDSPIALATGNSNDYPDVIGSADTLDGASIIFPVGSMAQIGVARYLMAFGLSLDDISTVNMNYGQGYQAFKGGESDVVAVFSPANYTAIQEGWIKLASLYDLKYDVKDVLIASPDALENPEKRSQITKLLELIYEVNDLMSEDENLQKSLLVDYYKEKGSEVDADMLPIEIENQYLMTSEMAKAGMSALGNSVLETAENYVVMGILEDDRIEIIKDCIDNSILEEVMKNK